MIVPFVVFLGTGVTVAIIVGYFYFTHFSNYSDKTMRNGVVLSMFAGFFSGYLLILPAKTIVVIEEGPHIKLSHHTFYCYGETIIRTKSGLIDTSQYDFRLGKKYIVNLSSCFLFYYPVRYVKKGRIKETGYSPLPDRVIIAPNDYMIISTIPDYWFCPPQKEVYLNEDKYSKLLSLVLGKQETRWCLSTY